MRKYWYRRFLLVLLVLSVLGYAGYEITKRQEQGRKKEVSADTVSSDTVIPGGMPVPAVHRLIGAVPGAFI